MISSYSNIQQSLIVDQELIFNSDRIKTGCTVTHTEGTAAFMLNKTGYYFINLNADGAATETGDVVLQLQSNGVDIPGALATSTSSGTADLINLSFSTIIQVPPSCCIVNNTPKITIVNTGVASTINNINLVITKLC